MKNIKNGQYLCIDLLNTFSEKELEALKDMASCRYFNSDPYVSRLLQVFEKYVLGKNTLPPTWQVKVYNEVFGDSTAANEVLDKKQRNHLNAKMSILTRLAEQFLVIENINRDELQKNELLYDTLLERKQIRLFEKRMKHDYRILNNQVKINELHHYRRYVLERKRMDYLYQTGQLISKDNLPEMIGELDTHYLINKLSLYNTALSLQNVSSKKHYDKDILKMGIIGLLEHPRCIQHPIVQLFHVCNTLFETRDTQTYLQLLELLDQYTEVVPIDLLKSFYGTTISYCADQIRTGHLEYSRKLFDLYKIMHEKNLFAEGNFIQIGRLKNVITIACREEEYNWAREILEYYRRFIQRNVRDSVYSFNLGAIAFYQKNYEDAHDKFIQVDKIDTIYDINTRVLILKCLYEKETEYNDYTMQAFRSAERFFKDHQSITPKSKGGYKNFIQILIGLYRTRHNVNAKSEDIERIKDKLDQQKVNSDKRWLLEKIGDLRGEM